MPTLQLEMWRQHEQTQWKSSGMDSYRSGCLLLACTKSTPVHSYFVIKWKLPQVRLHAVQPHVPPQQAQLINKHCPEGEEMEVGSTVRNSRKSESRRSRIKRTGRTSYLRRGYAPGQREANALRQHIERVQIWNSVSIFSTKVFICSWSTHIKK